MKIVKVPLLNSFGKTNGCEKAPDLIINSLKEITTNEKGKFIDSNLIEIEEINLSQDMKNNYEMIFEKSKALFESCEKIIFLGGDHSISYPCFSGFVSNEEDPLLIIFDAHADSLISSKEPGNKDWVSKLVFDGFNPEKIILIALRRISIKEIEFLKTNKIKTLTMDILQEDLEGVCDSIMENARESSGFYLSIDIDSLDPAFAPGTSELEPGGLSTRDLIYILKRLMLLKNFKAADIAEINPNKDINSITIKTGAKILSEMI
jgi:agmatinase